MLNLRSFPDLPWLVTTGTPSERNAVTDRRKDSFYIYNDAWEEVVSEDDVERMTSWR